jgi:hypothetical protein
VKSSQTKTVTATPGAVTVLRTSFDEAVWLFRTVVRTGTDGADAVVGEARIENSTRGGKQ